MRAAAALILLAMLVFTGLLWPQDAVWVCPMDPDVRSHTPGVCPRCGMKLASKLPELAEYHMELATTPPVIKPGSPASLSFRIHDPWKGRPVLKFETVHEKLFHMFVIGQDLEFFVHDHPVFNPDGEFRYDNLSFPKPGMYRVLGDFYPEAATPQMIAKTVIVPGKAAAPVHLSRDYSTKDAKNMRVEFTTDPPQPVTGIKTQLHFRINPGDGFEKYLGAWGHMLAASEDLVDLIHTHPFIADGSPDVQFNLTFPRATPYRVWVQFQRNGVVNTAHFDIDVKELK